MRRIVPSAVLPVLLAVVTGTTPASGLVLPVRSATAPGDVVRGFEPPATRFGRGHLGIDLAARPGSAVRALRAGAVVFAGTVGAGRHVVVRSGDGRRVTYGYLATVGVRRGARVAVGTAVGTAGGNGPNHGGAVWHLGLRVGDRYVDPSELLRTRLPTVGLAPLRRRLAPRRTTGAPIGGRSGPVSRPLHCSPTPGPVPGAALSTPTLTPVNPRWCRRSRPIGARAGGSREPREARPWPS